MERVSSSVITVNGLVVFDASNFNQTVDGLTKTVTLEANNTLAVLLKSKPGGTITIKIVQTAQDHAEALIGPAGGIVTSPNLGVTVEIPALALSDTRLITIDKAQNAPFFRKGLGTAIEIGPTGTLFQQPIKITLPYNTSELPGQGIDPDQLAIFTFGSGGWWGPITRINTGTSTITGSTNHLTTFQVGAWTYSYQVLPLPPGSSSASAINDSGQVVGTGEIDGYPYVFYCEIYDGGWCSTMPLQDGWFGMGYPAINNRVDPTTDFRMVGTALSWDYGNVGFLWHNNSYTILIPYDWYGADATGVNDSGQVVGFGWDAGGQQRGFLYSNHLYTTLIPDGWQRVNGATTSLVINNNGQVAGDGLDAEGQLRGFLYSDHSYTTLIPDGWYRSAVNGINNNGHVVGVGSMDVEGQNWRGFVFNLSDHSYTTLIPDGWQSTYAYGINNHGQVAGSVRDTAGQNTAVVFNLSDHSYTTLIPDGWQSRYAYGINNLGQVLGFGRNASGEFQSFIAFPQE